MTGETHPLLEFNRLMLTRIEEGGSVEFLGNHPCLGRMSGRVTSFDTVLTYKSPSSKEEVAIKVSIEILDDVELIHAGYDPKQLRLGIKPEVIDG